MAGHPLRPAIRRRHGRPLPHHLADGTQPHPQATLVFTATPQRGSTSRISSPFGELFRTWGQVSYALLTRAPLSPKGPFDLHVLSTPPAFTLSQDQTLHTMVQPLLRALLICLMPRLRLAIEPRGSSSVWSSSGEKPHSPPCRMALLSHLFRCHASRLA